MFEEISFYQNSTPWSIIVPEPDNIIVTGGGHPIPVEAIALHRSRWIGWSLEKQDVHQTPSGNILAALLKASICKHLVHGCPCFNLILDLKTKAFFYYI
jgi:hypothetical protein